jgi:hypothetical protein
MSDDFVSAIPKNKRELAESLQKLADNRKHVQKVEVNATNGHLEVRLDWTAHHLGHTPDFFLPIKRARLNDAKALVDRMARDISDGHSPPDADITLLYDMIDQGGSR